MKQLTSNNKIFIILNYSYFANFLHNTVDMLHFQKYQVRQSNFPVIIALYIDCPLVISSFVLQLKLKVVVCKAYSRRSSLELETSEMMYFLIMAMFVVGRAISLPVKMLSTPKPGADLSRLTGKASRY